MGCATNDTQTANHLTDQFQVSSLPDSFKQLIFYLGVYEWHLHVTDNIKRAWSADGEEIDNNYSSGHKNNKSRGIGVMRFSTKCVWFKSLDRWDKSGWEKLLCITLCSDLLHEGASGGLAPQFYFWAPQFQLHTKKQNKTNTTKCFFLSEINLCLAFVSGPWTALFVVLGVERAQRAMLRSAVISS